MFWEQAPALLYGLAMCIGCAYALGFYTEANISTIFLIFPALNYPLAKRLLLRFSTAALVGLSMFLWISASYISPSSLPLKGLKGEALVAINSLSKVSHPFGDKWLYRGAILQLTPEGHATPIPTLKNLPVTISLPDKEDLIRPSASSNYLIRGILKASKSGKYYFQTTRQHPWTPIVGTWSAAEWRYRVKEMAIGTINERYTHSGSQTFLSGLATGSFDDRLMALDFSRFGLQHIMAISGFHFSLIASFFSVLLGTFLNKKRAFTILSILLTTYFVFLGPTASIIRAWVMCLIACGGILLERPTFSLNSLGMALMVVLLIDPLQIHSLGFQFSFGVTAAILLLFAPIDSVMQQALKKRTLEEALNLRRLDRHAYILLSIIRQGASLTLAVNLVAIPITLFYFQQFPFMSILFNLFFPVLVGIAMILLIFGLSTDLIFPVGSNPIHSINNMFTQIMLNLTTYTPKAFDVYLRSPPLPAWSIMICCCAIFCTGVYWSRRDEEQWSFI